MRNMLSEVLRNPSLTALRESRRPLNPRVPPRLHIPNNRLATGTTVATITIRTSHIRRVVILVVRNLLLIIMLRYTWDI
jgi:hypothetical protein